MFCCRPSCWTAYCFNFMVNNKMKCNSCPWFHHFFFSLIYALNFDKLFVKCIKLNIKDDDGGHSKIRCICNTVVRDPIGGTRVVGSFCCWLQTFSFSSSF